MRLLPMVVIPAIFVLSLSNQSLLAGEKLVSSKVINSKGYPLKIGGGIEANITHIKSNKTPNKECRLDVNSLKKIKFDKYSWKRVDDSAKATIKLQAMVSTDGVPFCSNTGKGCEMTVEVPSLTPRAAKILGIDG